MTQDQFETIAGMIRGLSAEITTLQHNLGSVTADAKNARVDERLSRPSAIEY